MSTKDIMFTQYCLVIKFSYIAVDYVEVAISEKIVFANVLIIKMTKCRSDIADFVRLRGVKTNVEFLANERYVFFPAHIFKVNIVDPVRIGDAVGVKQPSNCRIPAATLNEQREPFRPLAEKINNYNY